MSHQPNYSHNCNLSWTLTFFLTILKHLKHLILPCFCCFVFVVHTKFMLYDLLWSFRACPALVLVFLIFFPSVLILSIFHQIYRSTLLHHSNFNSFFFQQIKFPNFFKRQRRQISKLFKNTTIASHSLRVLLLFGFFNSFFFLLSDCGLLTPQSRSRFNDFVCGKCC